MERLESLLANGKKLPLTSSVVVDQVAALDLIDQLRVAVPEEIRNARRINSEGERLIDQARDEAERIIARAQEQAAFLIDERELTRAAEEEGRRIVAQAEAEGEDVRRGADEYAASVLVGLEGEVVRTLASIRRGIELLDERHAVLRAGDVEDSPEQADWDEAQDESDDRGQANEKRRQPVGR